MTHEDAMRLALEEARLAAAGGEIPVGAVILRGDRVIARGRNDRERTRSPLGHAELRAIERACAARRDWRLSDCVLYVTLEPCAMCAGAVLHARLPLVVYGAPDPEFGCFGSHLNFAHLGLGGEPGLIPRVLESECRSLLDGFFRNRRA